MSAPETKLDTRFSEADAVATSWNDTRQVLKAAELFWITIVRRVTKTESGTRFMSREAVCLRDQAWTMMAAALEPAATALATDGTCELTSPAADRLAHAGVDHGSTRWPAASPRPPVALGESPYPRRR
jgi:hypothetical protein